MSVMQETSHAHHTRNPLLPSSHSDGDASETKLRYGHGEMKETASTDSRMRDDKTRDINLTLTEAKDVQTQATNGIEVCEFMVG